MPDFTPENIRLFFPQVKSGFLFSSATNEDDIQNNFRQLS